MKLLFHSIQFIFFTLFFTLFFSLFPNIVKGQILKGAGIVYTNGVPTHIPRISTESEIAINISNGLIFVVSIPDIILLSDGKPSKLIAYNAFPIHLFS